MTADKINKKENPFPTYLGSNDSLLSLLNKTSQIICQWFSDAEHLGCLLYTSPSPRDRTRSRMPSSA